MSRPITIYRRLNGTQTVEAFCSAELIQESVTHVTFQSQEHLPFGTKYCHYVLRKVQGGKKEVFVEIEVDHLSKTKPPYPYIKVVGKYKDVEEGELEEK